MSISQFPPFMAICGLRLPAMIALSVLLTGCDDAGSFDVQSVFKAGQDEANTTPEPTANTDFTEKDVEAPEVFSAQEAGLWDGRPSLGGVWVAHPDVVEPERVLIRNQVNGQSVVGALFRRERDIPGPRLQLSSDAAEALGVLAGAPVELNVVALRKEKVAVSPPEPQTPQTEETITETLDPIAVASAAIDAAEPVQSSLPVSSLDKPYVQVGIFSVETNAERVAQQMRSAGMVSSVRAQESSSKAFWRVLVGPASTASERKKLLAHIKAEGYSDAYAVTN
ncbi:SPOR domain-containing protein [Roseobacter litoralis]|uniref:SPOR domain-containing protein n=1 Tax=Roseobacter litoralis TaxID=42443 RepID=UPI002494DCB9|nr:SPOR domain-containing protein [Roseobacter litoralis]